MRFLFPILLLCSNWLSAQCSFELNWEYPYNGIASPLSLQPDALDRPYLYVASNSDGLVVLSTSGAFVTALSPDEVGDNVMNLTQKGELLYLAIGNNFAQGAPPGLAILDVADPAQPVVLGIWQHLDPVASNGSGIVQVEGDYAYLGAMRLGLMILNISDPTDITLISELPLDNDYPVENTGNPFIFNARGMQVQNDLAYICYGSGGLRIVDCSDKQNPVEIGKYANPITYEPINQPRAYNNVVLNGSLAYVAVDYCGVEVLDVSDPEDIKLFDHYNLHDCPTGSWYDAVWHTNELILNEACDKLFVSSASSELIALDVSETGMLSSCGMYGSLEDTTATWGIGMRNDSIYLAYLLIPIYLPNVHPFDSKWNGVKMVRWTDVCIPLSAEAEEKKYQEAFIYPNPTESKFQIVLKEESSLIETFQFSCFSLDGQLIWEVTRNGNENLEFILPPTPGVYLIRMKSGLGQRWFRIIRP